MVPANPATHGGRPDREKAVYTPEAGQSPLVVWAALLWVLPQLLRLGEWWSVAPAAVIGLFVVWSGVTTAVGSSSWYRLGLDGRLIAPTGVGHGSRVLNAACGTGSLAVSFAKAIGSGEVYATDRAKPSKRRTDPLQRTRDNVRIEGVDAIVRVQEADPLALPFKSGYFNAVGSRYGVSRERRGRRGAMLELLRVARPGAYLVLAESLPVALWLRYVVLPPLAAEYRVGDVRLSRFHYTALVFAQKLS